MPKYKFCKTCPLFEQPMFVPKKINTRGVMVVGEYSSLADVRNRLMFSSIVDQRARKAVREVGFDVKGDVYYTSVVKCSVPKYQKIDLNKATDCCSKILKKEIGLCQPKLIIGFGNLSLRAFTGKSTGIVKKRGIATKLDTGEIFYPCLTPAYIDMNRSMAGIFKRDIQTAYNTYSMLGKTAKNSYVIVDSIAMVDKVFNKLMKQSKFSYDFETTGLDPYTMPIFGIGFSWQEHTGVYIPITHRKRLDNPIDCPDCNKVGIIVSDTGRKRKCPRCKGSGTALVPSELEPYWGKKDEKYIVGKIRNLFSREHKVKGKLSVKFAHNMSFEHRWALHKWQIDIANTYDAKVGNCFDTQLYAYARNPATKGDRAVISLGRLVSVYPDMMGLKDIWNGIPESKDVLTPRDLSKYRSTEKIGKYCAGDCDGTLRLGNEYLDDIELFKPRGKDFKRFYYDRLMPTMFFISNMIHQGIYVDKDKWKIVNKEAIRIESEALVKLFSDSYIKYGSKKGIKYKLPADFNFKSTPQLQRFCFGKLHYPKLKKTKKSKDKISIDKMVLEVWNHQYNLPFAINLQAYRAITYHRSNIIRQMSNLCNPTTGRVHASIKMWVTETGRLSISDPPLHGTPSRGEHAKLVRSILNPSPGYVIIGADYSQIELRIIAFLSGDSVLMDAYLMGKDVHSITGCEMFSVTSELLTPLQRYIGKTCNFALCYKGSWRVLLRELGNYLAAGLPEYAGMTEQELLSQIIPQHILEIQAQVYHERFFKTYTSLKGWNSDTIRQARQDGFAMSLYGRVRYLPDLNSRDNYLRTHAESAAVNHCPQSTASDYLLFRFQDIVQAGIEEGINIRPLVPIHDALYFEVLEKDAERAAEIVKVVGIVQDEANIGVPMVLEPKIGKDFSEV